MSAPAAVPEPKPPSAVADSPQGESMKHRQWFTALVGGDEYSVVLNRIEASSHMAKLSKPFDGDLDMWFAEVVAREPPITLATARLNAAPHEPADLEMAALYRAIKNGMVVELHLLDPDDTNYNVRAGWAIRPHTEDGRGVPLVLRVDEYIEEDDSFES